MQAQLFETAPIVPKPKGIEEIAPGVFRNHDSGCTWSLRRPPQCGALHKNNGEIYMCNRRKTHRGKHKQTSHATGTWVRTRWTDSECYDMAAAAAAMPKRKAPRIDPSEPRRELPLSSKQSIRRKSLARRVNAKAPLFAEGLIAAELDSNPDYFGTNKGTGQ